RDGFHFLRPYRMHGFRVPPPWRLAIARAGSPVHDDRLCRRVLDRGRKHDLALSGEHADRRRDFAGGHSGILVLAAKTKRMTPLPYMRWAKLESGKARFNLATSGVTDFPLTKLPVEIGDLEIN